MGGGGKTTFDHQKEPIRIVPHPRTLRKAREHIWTHPVCEGFLLLPKSG